MKNNSSALFFNSSRPLKRSRSLFCMTLCGSAEVTFKINFRSLEVDGCDVLQVCAPLPHHSLRGGKLSVGSGIGRPSQ
jgi:hypothetical protein